MLLIQLPMTFMLQQLTQNNVGIYSFSTYDYPNGVTRAALLTAFIALATASGNYDAAGNWNTQAYLPALMLEAKLLSTPAMAQAQSALPNGASGSIPTIAVGAGLTGAQISGGNSSIGTGSSQLDADASMINNPSAVS